MYKKFISSYYLLYVGIFLGAFIISFSSKHVTSSNGNNEVVVSKDQNETLDDFLKSINGLTYYEKKRAVLDRVSVLSAQRDKFWQNKRELRAKARKLDHDSYQRKDLDHKIEELQVNAQKLSDEIRSLFDFVHNVKDETKSSASVEENDKPSNTLKSTYKKVYNTTKESEFKSDDSSLFEIDLDKAKEILDRDHQGMDKVKEHILEYLAVQKRVQGQKGPAICLLGPPGVGKTTLAKSIAEAAGRKFVRISLGGVNTEAAIRGFDRTYNNAQPGAIAKALKEAGTNNPVILLDEIDKLGGGGLNGDPSAALLEVLDPSQNHNFKDNYESKRLDLSKVMFIATSNSYNIPKPLLDRLEIVEMPRYTLEEKLSIAKANIIPSALKENGLSDTELTFTDEVIVKIIKEHTGEAGLRQLSRIVNTICRKVVKEFYDTKNSTVHITPDNLSRYIRKDQSIETRDYNSKLEKLISLPAVYKKGEKELLELESEKSNSGQLKRYLECFFDVPWLKYDQLNNDLKNARKILDRDHQGLEKIKAEIIEHLATHVRVNQTKPTIICFVGPPGVGKTTLGKSIAEATGRKFARVALGGVSNEFDIRGWARSFQNAQPGKIIQALKEAGSLNPVILLDEIDKMGENAQHGNPYAALLEVLDPTQNKSFKDHFLEVDVDLSQIMFIATANSHEIPAALRDRLEIIELSSYTLEEKVSIAKKNLIPKALKDNGLSATQIEMSDDVLISLIENYTLEAGVRQLMRTIDSLYRKVHLELDDKKIPSMKITDDKLSAYLGNAKIPSKQVLKENMVGVTQGLAWSPVGGEVMRFEAAVIPGSGKIEKTGNLGAISQESIMAALTVAKKMLPEYKVNPRFLEDKDLHVHSPSAVKKDGPSAGITITTSIVSAITNIPVNKDVCMTGEVSLNGDVLPIGGLKEKLIGAHKLGLKIAIIPAANIPDLDDVPQKVKKDLKIIPVKHISEVLKVALIKDVQSKDK